jgi:integrase
VFILPGLVLRHADRRCRSLQVLVERGQRQVSPHRQLEVSRVIDRQIMRPGQVQGFTLKQAGRLIQAIDTSTPVGLRDRALIAVMVFTAARAGAIAKLRVKHFAHDGSQWALRFEEKGGKAREIPVRHDLERFLREYTRAACLEKDPPDVPPLRSPWRTSGQLTDRGVTGVDLCRMVKRRLKDAGLPARISRIRSGCLR